MARPQLVVVDAGPRGGAPREEWQEGPLRDGSRHRIHKRFFDEATLVAELGGAESFTRVGGSWRSWPSGSPTAIPCG